MGKIMKRMIHINQHIIKSNSKTGERKPVITCKTYKDNIYGYEVDFVNGKVMYSPDKPLSCGAKVWIETTEPVQVLTETGWQTL
jgi:hypothetical protein